jgi:hypothetical protein
MTTLLAPGGSLLERALMISKCDIHVNLAAHGAKAKNDRLSVLAALGALLRGMNGRRMHSKVEALIVQDSDCVSDNLIGQFADRFAD